MSHPHLMIWLMVGCATAWAASLIVGASLQSTLLNLPTGMAGAAMAGWVLLPIFGVSTLPQSTFVFSWASFFVSVVGSLMLMTLVHLLRPDSPR